MLFIMKKSGYTFLLLFFSLFATIAVAQTIEDESLVQFSGMVLDGSTDELFPVPLHQYFSKK